MTNSAVLQLAAVLIPWSWPEKVQTATRQTTAKRTTGNVCQRPGLPAGSPSGMSGEQPFADFVALRT